MAAKNPPLRPRTQPLGSAGCGQGPRLHAVASMPFLVLHFLQFVLVGIGPQTGVGLEEKGFLSLACSSGHFMDFTPTIGKMCLKLMMERKQKYVERQG